MATDIGGVWRTIGGRRIFIKDGEDLETAMKNSGKFGKKEIKEKEENKEQDFSKSKVTKTLYHGTGKDFENFESDKIGSTTGNNGLFGRGFYFTENENLAKDYIRDENNNYAKKGYVFETKINVQKPFEWKSIKTEEQFNNFKKEIGLKNENIKWNKNTNEIHMITDKEAENEFTTKLKEKGYDGVIYKYDKTTSEYVVFDNKQIKVIKRKETNGRG